jgi:uncharacterized protein GlcG (DUF336 family)
MKKKLILTCLSLISIYATAQKEAEKTPTATSSIVAYGESITLEAAKKILMAGQAFAISKQWTVVIAIVDTGGNLVLLEKMDNTQIGSIEVAMGKAKTANNFKRPTKVFEDVVASGGGGLRVLSIPGVFPIEGGEPILYNGKIIGGIGVSGMSSAQDEEVVKAGLAALR